MFHLPPESNDTFMDRATRARSFYHNMLADVLRGLRSQSDAEESAIRKLTEHGYDYESSRSAVVC